MQGPSFEVLLFYVVYKTENKAFHGKIFFSAPLRLCVKWIYFGALHLRPQISIFFTNIPVLCTSDNP
jgi:hypothetical protein